MFHQLLGGDSLIWEIPHTLLPVHFMGSSVSFGSRYSCHGADTTSVLHSDALPRAAGRAGPARQEISTVHCLQKTTKPEIRGGGVCSGVPEGLGQQVQVPADSRSCRFLSRSSEVTSGISAAVPPSGSGKTRFSWWRNVSKPRTLLNLALFCPTGSQS